MLISFNRKSLIALAITSGFSAVGSVALTAPAAAQGAPANLPNRMEVIPIETLTISDARFLAGNTYGTPATIGGYLRVAQGAGPLPLVILLSGSGGVSMNLEVWGNQFLEMGISVFLLDSFAGRGIISTVVDQSQLGRLNMILDLYRALSVLADHPNVDSSRIAVMGFSRGGQAALYSSLTRFHDVWNTSGVEPVAYIPLYPTCSTTLIGDTNLRNSPVRIFHGIADDLVPIQPCRDYVSRLASAGQDVVLTEFPNAGHAYDYVSFLNLPTIPFFVAVAQTTHCELKEEPAGVIINVATQEPFSYADDCVGAGANIAYDAAATEATEAAVKDLLRSVFGLE